MINFETIKKPVFDRFLKEYESFLKYINKDIFEKAHQKFCEFYNYECGINPEIYFGLYLQNQVDKNLCDQVAKGNIDLEIELIEKYMPILEYIIRQKRVENDIDKEGIIIAAIESYDGSKLFSLHMLDILKSCDFGLLPIEKPKPRDFNTVVEEYLKESSITPYIPNYYESLFIKFNVLDYILDNDLDEELKEYAYLKYGGYKNICFSDEDIMKFLNVDQCYIAMLAKRCLLVLKHVLNENIDLLINFYLNNCELGQQFTKYITKNNS